MPDYQVIARKFRPQSFKEVVGQDPIVTTLKNAIRFNRLAQAYLFCGSRGTGKTTLARIFAKALNCHNISADFEPCNQCASCREIGSGSSLDILEIDGASHRGIEDIRQINENVGYATASGRYKIYIIDEVHMLTKEAFNALLKTLEEPPPKVKFFFATTEPHKILPTILSRCQRFNLSRISPEKIVYKLNSIAKQLNVEADDEALCLIAQQAEGGLRDAESLFDQILAFENGKVTAASVNAILGLMSKDTYFEIDYAGKEGNLGQAFDIAHQIFSQGKDLNHFVDGLIEHYRNILLMKLSGKDTSLLFLSPQEKEKYQIIAPIYTQEQCIALIDYLVQAQNQLRFATSPKILLESILLHIMRSHFRMPIEILVRRLGELEQAIASKENSPQAPINMNSARAAISTPTISDISHKPSPMIAPQNVTRVEPNVELKPKFEAPIVESKSATNASVTVDPTPSRADLGMMPAAQKAAPVKKNEAPPMPAPTSKPINSIKSGPEPVLSKPTHHYDTLLNFAAIELEGKIQRT